MEEPSPAELKDVREKMAAFCVYRERSQREVRDKLRQFPLSSAEVESLISELIQHNFLNEERFARAYVRGKFYQKGWGRRKIKAGLRYHQLSDYLLRKAFQEIEGEDYREKLQQFLWKHRPSPRPARWTFQERGKLAQQAIRRGYESELVWQELDRLTGRG